MFANNADDATTVRIWFDPACPFAWITSRWLLELEALGEVRTHMSVMSLAVLDEHNEVPAEYRVRLNSFWGAVRLAVAVESHRGQGALRDLYTALGSIRHVEGQPLDARALHRALDETGLPLDLADVAVDPAWDQVVRASHDEGVSLVGADVGTPILQTPEGAIFGPILTKIPRGADASRLWANVRALVADENFFELKRTRDRTPEFD